MSLKRILNFLPNTERKRLFGMVFLMLISGFLEAVSVISIAPFLALAASPD